MIPSVVEIEAMDRAALMDAWVLMFRSPVPKRLSASFLRRFLAFEVQAQFRRTAERFPCMIRTDN